jgi:hypothetical protein
MTYPARAPQDLLIRVGFTPPQIEALRLAWENPSMDYFLNNTASAILEQGGTPADALDFIEHRLDASATGFYFNHGLTAHQAHIIDADPHAKNNLWDRPGTGPADILDLPIPRAHVVDVLRVAASADDVGQRLNRYQALHNDTTRNVDERYDDITALELDARDRAAALPYVGLTCACQYPQSPSTDTADEQPSTADEQPSPPDSTSPAGGPAEVNGGPRPDEQDADS